MMISIFLGIAKPICNYYYVILIMSRQLIISRKPETPLHKSLNKKNREPRERQTDNKPNKRNKHNSEQQRCEINTKKKENEKRTKN